MADKTQNNQEFDIIPFGDEVVRLPKGMSEDEQLRALQKLDPDYKQYKELYLDIPGVQNIPSFPEYKKQLQATKAEDERRANRGVGEKALGVGETALSTGSAVGSAFLSPFVWGGESIVDLVKGRPVESFENRFSELMQEGTYQPRTEAGQEYTKDVGDFITESKVEGAIGTPILGRLGNLGTGTAIKEGVKQVGSKVGEQVGKVVPKVEGGLTSQLFGMTTGAGKNPIRIAFETGKQGTKKEVDAFLKGIEGNASPESLVQRANNALNQIKKQIGLEYQANKAKLQTDKQVIGFDDIDAVLDDIKQAGKFERTTVNPSTVAMQTKIRKIVNAWKKKNPKKYHTPEGIDALKRRIGDLYDSTQPGTQERLVVDKVYNSIGDTIRANAPTYDKMMSQYAQGKNLIREIQDTFSLKEKKSVDTQFRKLTSILRDGVNANFGERFNLAQRLNQLDPTLFPELAGESLKSLTPQGIQRAIGSGNILGNLYYGLDPLVASSLLTQSPKIVGKGAFQLGKGIKGVQNMTQRIGDAIKTPEMPSLFGTGSTQVTDPLGLLGISER
jgi:hypothetical protein